MASIFFKYYADVEQMSDAAVKSEYGVSKSNVLKVLEKFLIEDITSSGKMAAAPAKKRGRKPGQTAKKPGKRGRKPGRKPAEAKVPAKRGRKPMAAKQPVAPKIEVS